LKEASREDDSLPPQDERFSSGRWSKPFSRWDPNERAKLVKSISIPVQRDVTIDTFLSRVLHKFRINAPATMFVAVSGYLLIAIGLKGGAALTTTTAGEAALAVGLAIAVSAITPFLVFPVLERWIGLNRVNAAAVAAHYGSVSIVTFTIAITFLERMGHSIPPYAIAMAAAMELPAILTAITLSGKRRGANSLLRTCIEVLTGRPSVLLLGGLVVGFAFSGSQFVSMFIVPFGWVLLAFLVLMGFKVVTRLGDLKNNGIRLTIFAVFTPLILGVVATSIGYMTGLGVSAAVVLGTLAASASYIAAPAAVAKAIPEASPAIYLAPPLIVTFPFNVLLGIFIYYRVAMLLTGTVSE